MNIEEELATAKANLQGHQDRSVNYIHIIDKQKERIRNLEGCIRELLKGGEHEDECDNDQGMLNEGGACQKHCAMSEQREAAAKKLLEAKDGTT
jgi:hypothetical protein